MDFFGKIEIVGWTCAVLILGILVRITIKAVKRKKDAGKYKKRHGFQRFKSNFRAMKNVQKEQENMIAIIYKALGEGLSKLIRNGTGLSILTAVCGGLVYAMLMLHSYHQRLHDELKEEIKVIKMEKERETEAHYLDLAQCQNENRILAVKVAELTVIVNRLQKSGALNN